MQRMRRGRLALVLATAAFLAVTLTATASANRFSLSEQETLILWDDLDFAGGLIQCDVSLRVTFHARTFTKVPGSLVAHVTLGAFRNCTAGIGATLLSAALPWHIQFDSFTGTLPNVTGFRLRLVGFAVLFDLLGNTCLYSSTVARPFFLIANRNAGGTLTGMSADEVPAIPLLTRLSGICPETINFSGTGGLSRLVTVTLV